MTAGRQPYNLVIIGADTLRPDHLSSYGYRRETSPNLDRLAAEGARFADFQAAHIPTHPAFTTLLTGVDPLRHGILAHSGSRQLRPDVPMLAQRLHEAGYVSAAVDNMLAMQAGPTWFARGFDYFRSYRYAPGTGEAARLTDWALELLALVQQSDAPFALFVHYFDPHTPYAPPPEFRRRFYTGDERDPVNHSLRAVVETDDALTPLLLGDLWTTGVTDIEYVLAQYDGEIAFLDQQVGRLLAALETPALRERTLVLFLSDHGEAFGEGGLYFDHHTLHDAVTRCALLMRLPGVIPAGTVVGGLASSMDITPTILDLLALPAIAPALQPGRSLRPLLEGRSVREDAPLGEASRQVSHGVVTPEWRLIQPITRTAAGRPVPDFRGRQRDPALLLFHRPSDPGERRNVAAEHPAVVEDLQERLRRRLRAAAPFTGTDDPFRHCLPSLPFDVLVERQRQRSGPTAAHPTDRPARPV
ncbi:MAG TPA: sulfatase [Chloroflexota bacterium]|nr:sulfatase [Chloroflexota bacterium]